MKSKLFLSPRISFHVYVDDGLIVGSILLKRSQRLPS